MCSRFEPPPPTRLGLHTPWPIQSDYPAVVFPTQQAPIIRLHDTTLARFGMIPPWVTDIKKQVRSTFNARAETASSKPSYRHAWKQRQTCLVPMVAFHEPCYEANNRNVWHRIYRKDKQVMMAAGLWEAWRRADGSSLLSMTLPTINADGHPIMQGMHKREDEKRSIVILNDEAQQTWLNADNNDELAAALQLFDATAFAAEPVRKRRPPFGGFE